VNLRRACRAEGDQILFGIVPRLDAEPFVVTFKVGPRAARLAPPAVSTERLLADLVIQFWT
jgi:hypothetical protein